MDTRFFLVQLLNGLSFGGLLFFVASGFTLIFGLMRIVNLAHGGFFLVGGFVGLSTIRVTGSFIVGVLAGGLAVAALGMFTERVLLRPIRGMVLPEVLLTVGLSFVLADLSLAIWGGDPVSVPLPDVLRGSFDLGMMRYPRYRLVVLGGAALLGVAMWLLQSRTRMGAMVRAGVDDRETVAALGINIYRVFTGVFVFGAMLVGFGGVLGGAMLGLLPGEEVEILLLGLVVVIIGGLGSLPGAAIGSALVGLLDTFGRAFFPELSYFTLFAPMAIVLVFRPTGLFGRA